MRGLLVAQNQTVTRPVLCMNDYTWVCFFCRDEVRHVSSVEPIRRVSRVAEADSAMSYDWTSRQIACNVENMTKLLLYKNVKNLWK